jgi:hypothetical protein
MHAIVVRTTIDVPDRAIDNLKETMIPLLKQMAGFVGAQWVRLDEHTGTSMLTFETAEAAGAVADMLRKNPPTGVTVNSVEVGEVVERV